jgi:hypothetical protein
MIIGHQKRWNKKNILFYFSLFCIFCLSFNCGIVIGEDKDETNYFYEKIEVTTEGHISKLQGKIVVSSENKEKMLNYWSFFINANIVDNIDTSFHDLSRDFLYYGFRGFIITMDDTSWSMIWLDAENLSEDILHLYEKPEAEIKRVLEKASSAKVGGVLTSEQRYRNILTILDVLSVLVTPDYIPYTAIYRQQFLLITKNNLIHFVQEPLSNPIIKGAVISTPTSINASQDILAFQSSATKKLILWKNENDEVILSVFKDGNQSNVFITSSKANAISMCVRGEDVFVLLSRDDHDQLFSLEGESQNFKEIYREGEVARILDRDCQYLIANHQDHITLDRFGSNNSLDLYVNNFLGKQWTVRGAYLATEGGIFDVIYEDTGQRNILFVNFLDKQWQWICQTDLDCQTIYAGDDVALISKRGSSDHGLEAISWKGGNLRFLFDISRLNFKGLKDIVYYK